MENGKCKAVISIVAIYYPSIKSKQYGHNDVICCANKYLNMFRGVITIAIVITITTFIC